MNSTKTTINEINAVGTHPVSGRKVTVKGIFIKADAKGKPKISPREVRTLGRYAREHNLPQPELIHEGELENNVDVSDAMIRQDMAHFIAKHAKAGHGRTIEDWKEVVKQGVVDYQLRICQRIMDTADRNLASITPFLKVVPASNGKFMLKARPRPYPFQEPSSSQ